MKKGKVRYYSDFTDDFEETKNQDFSLPDDYRWIKTGFFDRLASCLVYGIAVFLSFFYCKLVLRMKIIKCADTSKLKNGCFVYSNHTQPVGDVFIPAFCMFPKRIYTIVSPSNYGIPVIGKLLPYLGALPIPNSFSKLKELNLAIEERLKEGHPVIVFPEAHVWQYYKDIRPFPSTSFTYPVSYNVPALCMTVTYKKTRFFKRPKMLVYLDGPYYAEGETKKDRISNLHNRIFSKMTERSSLSGCSYIEYIKKEPGKSE